MSNIQAIWCDDVAVPSIGENMPKRVSYRFISKWNNINDYEKRCVTSPLATGTKEDFKRAVESCLNQANDHHHVFIEGFEIVDGCWDVVLGS